MSTSNQDPHRTTSVGDPSRPAHNASALRLLLPLLVVLAVAYGGYYFMSNQNSVEPEPVAISAEMLQAKPGETIQITDISIVDGHVSELFDELIPLVAATKDQPSLQVADSAIFDATERWASLHANRWPADAKEKMKDKLAKYLDQFQSALVTAYQVPGAREALEPSANNLIDRIKTGMPAQ